jgi:hypothetical protein
VALNIMLEFLRKSYSEIRLKSYLDNILLDILLTAGSNER